MVMLKKSRIRHPTDGMGVFASRPKGKGNVVGYYNSAMAYEDLTAEYPIDQTRHMGST